MKTPQQREQFVRLVDKILDTLGREQMGQELTPEEAEEAKLIMDREKHQEMIDALLAAVLHHCEIYPKSKPKDEDVLPIPFRMIENACKGAFQAGFTVGKGFEGQRAAEDERAARDPKRVH